MPVAFLASSTANNGATSSTVGGVTLPAFTVSGPTLAIIFASQASNANTITVPSGWLNLGNVIGNSSTRVWILTKWVANTDASTAVTITWSGSGANTTVARVYSGVGSLRAVLSTGGSATTLNIPAVPSPAWSTGFKVACAFLRGAADGTVVTVTVPTGYANTAGASTSQVSPNRNETIGTWDASYTASTVAAATTTASVAATSYGSVMLALGDADSPQATRPVRRRVPAVRRPVVSRVVTAQASVVTVYPPAARPAKRSLRGLLRRGAAEVPVAAQAAPVPPTFTPVAAPKRSLRSVLRRGRGAFPVPAQAVVAPSPLVPVAAPKRSLRALLRRGRGSTPVPAQATPPRVPRERVTPRPATKARTASPPQPQAAPVPPSFVPQTKPNRGIRSLLRRGSTDVAVQTQAAPVPPARVSQGTPPRRFLVRLRRARPATAIPAQAAPIPPAFVAQNPPRRALRALLRRGSTDVAVQAQAAAPAVAYLPQPTPRRRFAALLRRRTTIVPAAQVTPPVDDRPTARRPRPAARTRVAAPPIPQAAPPAVATRNIAGTRRRVTVRRRTVAGVTFPWPSLTPVGPAGGSVAGGTVPASVLGTAPAVAATAATPPAVATTTETTPAVAATRETTPAVADAASTPPAAPTTTGTPPQAPTTTGG